MGGGCGTLPLERGNTSPTKQRGKLGKSSTQIRAVLKGRGYVIVMLVSSQEGGGFINPTKDNLTTKWDGNQLELNTPPKFNS